MQMKIKQNIILKCPYIPEYPYEILITGAGSGSGKTNALLNLISKQPGINKIYLYAKDLYEAKYQFLINKRESTGLKQYNALKLLLSIQMIWKMFTKILKYTMLVKNIKY